MHISLINHVILGILLYMIGLLGIIFNGKNIILILMGLEIILLSINYEFMAFSVHMNNILGQIISLLILTVAASESSIGLAILVAFYRVTGTIATKFMNLLRD